MSADSGLNASELAAHLGESRNRVFRLLRTLEENRLRNYLAVIDWQDRMSESKAA